MKFVLGRYYLIVGKRLTRARRRPLFTDSDVREMTRLTSKVEQMRQWERGVRSEVPPDYPMSHQSESGR